MSIIQKVVVTPNPADASPDETFGFAVSTLENFAPDLTELGQYFKKGYVNTNYVEDKTVK